MSFWPSFGRRSCFIRATYAVKCHDERYEMNRSESTDRFLSVWSGLFHAVPNLGQVISCLVEFLGNEISLRLIQLASFVFFE